MSKYGSGCEVNSYGIYVHNYASALELPPSLYVVDSNRVRDMPTVLYEVNSDRPSPCRTEFPYQIAAYASWQDFSGVFWHFWQPVKFRDLDYLTSAMPVVTKGWSDGLIYHANDPAMCAALMSAGIAFTSGAVKPAGSPAVYSLGKKGVAQEFFNGIQVSGTSFRQGAEIVFCDSDSALEAEGEIGDDSGEAVRGGDQILWDWAGGRLVVDSPEFKAHIGRPVQEHAFADGVTLLRPEGSGWASIAVNSLDGRTIGMDCSRMLLTGVSDAENTGFSFDPKFGSWTSRIAI